MAEAEDVIVDAARHATSYAMDLWRRNRMRPVEAAGVALIDVKQRLELVLEAALGRSFPIRAAVPPPPRTLLARWFAAHASERPRMALPGTDGASLFLPPHVDGGVEDALTVYRVTALQQAFRAVRGSAETFPWSELLIVQDLYLVSEAVSVERALVQLLPGMSEAVRACRQALLAGRPAVATAAGPMASVEALYRDVLAGRAEIACAESPRDALDWARRYAGALPLSRARYTGLVPDTLLGEIVRPDGRPVERKQLSGPALEAGPRRVVKLSRRPRVREASRDEDDETPGIWMVQSSPPNEHAEDPMGLQRPVDQQPDADLAGAGESVSDLDALRVVSTPGTSREILATDDAPFARASHQPHGSHTADAFYYPEWDYSAGAYRDRAAIVRVLAASQGPAEWVDATLARNRATLTRVRRRFEALRSRRSLFHAQPDGDEVDLDAFVQAYGDRIAGLPREDRLYVVQRPARRDFALLILIDVSGSTEAWVSGGQRIIDIEKEALVIVSSALDALRVRYAIQAFSGYGPRDVRVREVKSFGDASGRATARRVSALEPDEFTRSGAALRHATAALMREPAYRRLLLLLSDGKPNDCDRYEGRYGMEDMRQALAEARLQGISPFCVTVDRLATTQLASIFGAGNFTVVTDAPHLSGALIDWLRNVTVALA
ncbi:MAG: VWA domain-containing protein [Burkholderiales bacterium]